MTALHPDALSSDLIEFPADHFAILASRTRKNVFAAVMIAIAVTLFVIGGDAALAIGGALVVIAIVAMCVRSYVTTFDVARRQVTIVSMTSLSTRRRTLPFDAIQWLDFEHGDGGAALWLKDGSMLTVASVPDNYAELDRRLADIRSRTGLQAARFELSHADISAGVTTDPTGLVTITSENQHLIPRIVGGVATLLMTAITVVGGVVLLSTGPMPHTSGDWFGYSVMLLGVPLWILIGSFGVFLLFGPPTKLLLDPATRQLHVEGGFVRPRRYETIAFDDIANAGVIHFRNREGSNFTPYLKLKSDRVVHLPVLGGDFRRSDEVAEIVRQMTGATPKNLG